MLIRSNKQAVIQHTMVISLPNSRQLTLVNIDMPICYYTTIRTQKNIISDIITDDALISHRCHYRWEWLPGTPGRQL